MLCSYYKKEQIMQEDMFEGDENACGIHCGDGFMDVCLSPNLSTCIH